MNDSIPRDDAITGLTPGRSLHREKKSSTESNIKEACHLTPFLVVRNIGRMGNTRVFSSGERMERLKPRNRIIQFIEVRCHNDNVLLYGRKLIRNISTDIKGTIFYTELLKAYR